MIHLIEMRLNRFTRMREISFTLLNIICTQFPKQLPIDASSSLDKSDEMHTFINGDRQLMSSSFDTSDQ